MERVVSFSKPLVNIVFGALLAFIGLYLYDQKKIVAEDFALGKDNYHGSETWRGGNFTAANVADISSSKGLP